MDNVQCLFSILKEIIFIYEIDYLCNMQRVNIIVHGYVQGVFFRSEAKRLADRLGLKGYAKNMPDGTVEVIAEGQEDKIKGLIDFCKKGPEAAEVSKVDVKFEGATDEFDRFKIK